MKLHQNLLLGKDLGVETMLSAAQQVADNFRPLMGPCDFSFHPYLVSAYAEQSLDLPNDSKSLWEFRLDLLINDDEQHKPLFASMSQNRSLLLIAELSSCLNEALSALGLSIVSLTTNSLGLRLRLKTLVPLSHQQLMGAVMIVLNSIDSLLFLRGLALSQAVIEFLDQIDLHFSIMLKNMVNKLYAQL